MKKTDKFIFFWGDRDVYSNFHYSPFYHQGKKFIWSEQAVMYRKAMLFGAKDVAEQILKASSPKKCRDLGRSTDIPFKQAVWVRERERVYKSVLRDKFALPALRKQIVKSGDRVLAEASPFDKIWGIGLRDNHPDAENPEKWRGKNLLGKVLMEIREEILDGVEMKKGELVGTGKE